MGSTAVTRMTSILHQVVGRSVNVKQAKALILFPGICYEYGYFISYNIYDSEYDFGGTAQLGLLVYRQER
jgi:hypothetical protein